MKKIALFLFCFLSTMTFELTAQNSTNLSFQGIVRNSDGTALEDGKYEMAFTLYDAATGGTSVWTETQPEVSVKGGVYSVLLGSVDPISATFAGTHYLGVSIDGGAELTPRATLTGAPYALSLHGTTNTFPNDGTVGVGTNAPDQTYKLHVVGDVHIDGGVTATGGFGFDISNLTVDVHTTENISGTDVTASGNMDVTGNLSGGSDGVINVTSNLHAPNNDISGNNLKSENSIFIHGNKRVAATEESVDLKMLRGEVNGDGEKVHGGGWTSIENSTGHIKITFDTPFSDVPTVVVSHEYTGDRNSHIMVESTTTNEVFIETLYDSNNIGSNYTHQHEGFTFIVIGPK